MASLKVASLLAVAVLGVLAGCHKEPPPPVGFVRNEKARKSVSDFLKHRDRLWVRLYSKIAFEEFGTTLNFKLDPATADLLTESLRTASKRSSHVTSRPRDFGVRSSLNSALEFRFDHIEDEYGPVMARHWPKILESMKRSAREAERKHRAEAEEFERATGKPLRSR